MNQPLTHTFRKSSRIH